MFDINHYITSVLEMESFARYLNDEVKIAFHPDETFEDYVAKEVDCHIITRSGTKGLNLRVEESFTVCDKENVDIYEYMMQFSQIHSLMQN